MLHLNSVYGAYICMLVILSLEHLNILYCLSAVQHDADNLYFSFRWLLVSFKREFNYEDVMRVWEVWCFIGCILYVDRALC